MNLDFLQANSDETRIFQEVQRLAQNLKVLDLNGELTVLHWVRLWPISDAGLRKGVQELHMRFMRELVPLMRDKLQTVAVDVAPAVLEQWFAVTSQLMAILLANQVPDWRLSVTHESLFDTGAPQPLQKLPPEYLQFQYCVSLRQTESEERGKRSIFEYTAVFALMHWDEDSQTSTTVREHFLTAY